MTENRVVRFDVNASIIREALGLPSETKIIDIRLNGVLGETFSFVVSHPDLNVVEEGEEIPEMRPVWVADYEKRPATWLTFNWGQPKSEGDR